MEKIPEQILSFYNQLESITKFDRWELMKQLKPMTEMFEHKWNVLLNAEHMCLRFTMHEGELISDFYSVDENGKEMGFPTFDVFTNEQITYLKKRAEEVKNPLLIARYNHILFCTARNRNYGICALKAYKKLIYLELEDDAYDRFLPSIEAVLKLTENLKFEKAETKKELLKFVNSNQIKIYQKHIIITLLINGSLFKSHELKFFPALALEWVDQSTEKHNFYNKEILKNAIKICVNNGIDTDVYYEKLAENEMNILTEHPENSDFVKTQVLSEIVEYYKRAKNNEKYEKYLKEYTHAKAQIEFQLIDASPDENSQRLLNEENNKRVKIILTWDLDKILYHYSVHTPLFPDIDNIVAIATENFKNSFLRHVTSSVFDINNNVKTLSDDENLEREIDQNYQYLFGIDVLIEFIRVMQVGTYNRKISYQHVYEYLDRATWFGQNIEETKMRSGDTNISYKWLNLMAPALHSFLIQLETSFLIGKELTYTNWVLPIDSLTLKFEGALRDFIKILSGNTSVLKKNELQEMLLDDLLNCEAAKKVFSKNDLTLFKMIFTKKGDNIRHSVAHGFYHPGDYTMVKCCKIFLCILRLSGYKLVINNNSKE